MPTLVSSQVWVRDGRRFSARNLHGNGDPWILAQLTVQHSLKKPDRPTVGLDMSETEWAQFKFEFDAYKKDCGIMTNPEKIHWR